MKLAGNKIHVAEVFLINKEKRILLQLRDNKRGIAGRGRWGVFGGRRKEKESYSDCIKREVEEELGLKLRSPKLLQKTIDEKKPFLYEHHLFYDFLGSENPRLKEGRHMRFFTLEELESKKDKVPWFYVYRKALSKLSIILSKK